MHCKKSISGSLQRMLQHNLKSTVICSQGTDIAVAVEGTHPITLKHRSTHSGSMHHSITARKKSGFKALLDSVL